MEKCSHCNKEFKPWVDMIFQNNTEATNELAKFVQKAIYINYCKDCAIRQFNMRELEGRLEEYNTKLLSLTRERKYHKSHRDAIYQKLLSLEWEHYNAKEL
jgi:hypothetical protein